MKRFIYRSIDAVVIGLLVYLSLKGYSETGFRDIFVWILIFYIVLTSAWFIWQIIRENKHIKEIINE